MRGESRWSTRETFITRHTRRATAPLVPEVTLHLATDVTSLWQATEDWLDQCGVAPPYWAFAWPGSQALARLCLDRPELVRGRSVIDFAAGCGLAAIVAAQAGARSVTAVEIDPLAVAAIGLNAALNDVAVAAVAADILDDGDTIPGEVILAGDVCYEREMATRVWAWLGARAAAGATVLVADPGRAYLPQVGRHAVARFRVPTTRELEDRLERDTVIWRIAADDADVTTG